MRWKFLDLITETDYETFLKGTKTFDPNEEWTQDHFPGNPIVPGVLQIEMVANLTGQLVFFKTLKEHQFCVIPLLLKVKQAQFKNPIKPGTQIRGELTLERYSLKLVHSSGKLYVGQDLHATVSLVNGIIRPEDIGHDNMHQLLSWHLDNLATIMPSLDDSMHALIQQELSKHC